MKSNGKRVKILWRERSLNAIAGISLHLVDAKKHRREYKGGPYVTSRAKIEQITRRNVRRARGREDDERKNNGKAECPYDEIGDQKTSKRQSAM